jgi:hypothetical protein
MASWNPFKSSKPAPAPPKQGAPLQPGQQGPVQPTPSTPGALTPSGPVSVSPSTPSPSPKPSPFKPTGGGGSGGGGGGGSSPSPTYQGPLQPGTSFTATGGTTPSASIAEVNAFAKQVAIQDEINRQNLIKQQQELTRDIFNPRTSSSTMPFGMTKTTAEQRIEQLEGNQQSVKAPNEQQLEYLRGKIDFAQGGGVSGGGGIREVYNEFKERFTTSPKISAEVASNAFRGIKNQEVAGYYWRQNTAKQNEITANMNAVATEKIQAKQNELQARADAGEDVDALNKELEDYRNKVSNEVYAGANKEYKDWFNEFSTTGAGSQFEKNALKDIIKFNARFTAPRAKEIFKSASKAFTGGAIAGGATTAVVGGLGLFGGAVGRVAQRAGALAGKAFSAPAQIVIGSVVLGKQLVTQGMRVKQLQRDYGFTEGEAQRIARREAQTAGINFVTGYGAGFAGAYSGSKIVGVALTGIKKASVNQGTKDFIDKLKTDRATQDRVFTDANLKKGFIIEKIQGVKVKIPITQAMSRAVYGKREGLFQDTQSLGTGINQQAVLEQAFLENTAFRNALQNAGINLDRGFSFAEIQTRTATGITRQRIGRLDRVFQATYREGNIVKGFTFKLTSSGKITSIKLLKGTINPKTGTITTQATKLIKTPVKIQKGVLEVTGKVVGPPKLTIAKIIQKDVNVVGGGKGRKITSEVAIAQAKGAKIAKADSIFKTPTAQEFFNSGQMQIIDPSKVKIVQKGQSRRISVTKDVNLFGQQGSQEMFGEVIRTTTARKALEILPKVKAPPTSRVKPTDSLFTLPQSPSTPSPTSGGDKPQSLLFTSEMAQSLEQSTGLGFITGSKGSSLSQLKITGTSTIPKVKSVLGFNFLETSTTRKEQPIIVERGLTKELLKTDRLKDNFILGSISSSSFNTGTRTNIQQKSMLATQTLFQPLVTKTLVKPSLTSPLKPVKPLDFGFFGGGLGEIQVGGGQKGKAPQGSLFGETEYTASLGNVLLGSKRVKVSREQAKALGQVTYSGLELRPQIQVIDDEPKKKRFSLF